MRIRIIPLLLITTLLSCKQPESQEAKLKRIIQGVWEDKIELEQTAAELERAARTNTHVRRDTSSPPHIITLDIETDKIFGQIVPTNIGLSNGEGSTMNFILQPGKFPRSVLTAKNYEIAYKIKGGDTSLILYRPDKNKIVSREFIMTLRSFPRFGQ